jgi:peptide/nickel transport system ATP-binding protein
MSTQPEPLLEVRGLSKHFAIRKGFLGRDAGSVRAVDDVDLSVRKGEAIGLVGETGCGKTTLGRCIARAYEPTSGSILYRREDGETIDAATLGKRDLKPYRRDVRVVFQDPYSSLNPRMTLLQIIGEPLKVHGIASGSELEERVAGLLRKVGLRPEYLRRYPHAFSGGERQRVSIARALALDPRLVVADEAVSALDVSVRAQILNLLDDLQAENDLTYLMITHDLSVVDYICDRVAVMYLGRIVELADTQSVYDDPQHPYTEALLSAIPKPDPRQRLTRERITFSGELPDPSNPPPGCPFHTRCAYARDVCATDKPPLRPVKDGHLAACHFSEELQLAPA